MTKFEGHGGTEVTTPDELTSVDTYREYVFKVLPKPQAIQLRTQDALGLVLIDSVDSADPLPGFANSGMDGYAVRAADVAAATADNPVMVRVVGEAAAGTAVPPKVGEGEAARIMTGGPLPPGADAVVPVELSSGTGVEIGIHVAPSVGQHVRRVGEDVRPGDRLADAGTRLNPAHIGLLIAAGVTSVSAYPSPRVVVLTTGDELVPADQPLGPGQIRDSNGPMLAAAIRDAGGTPYLEGPVPDTRQALAKAIESATGHADVVLLTGGASAGRHDHVEDVVAQLGEVAKFKVAMKPGMPQIIGRVEGVPVFGLPGNPVSSLVSFEIFVRPALRLLQGRSDLLRPVIKARLAEEVTAPLHKRAYIRVTLTRTDGEWVATPSGSQGSHVLSSLSRADGLAEVPEDVTRLGPGDPIKVNLLVMS